MQLKSMSIKCSKTTYQDDDKNIIIAIPLLI